MTTTVHIIPHAHWDREWYLPLEIHQARLIDQLDNVLELLGKDPEYTYHLDGQMAAAEDYLQFRPENEELMRGFVRKGRLHAGPWYVLQDEYLTSGEANVRNLLYGMEMAEKLGGVCRIGYLPDAFGNVGQMPQLFRQAGLKAAVFGRGVTLRPEDPDPAAHFPAFSEFSWVSPDGSSVPAIFFAGWYNNAAEIPADPAAAKAWWDERLAHARRFASTEHLLFMNGSDHQPVQKDLKAALETARKLYPDIRFICSDLEHFADCVLRDRQTVPERVIGELAGQESDGTNTLCNTASAQMPLKLLNRRNESLLAMQTEPLASMAVLSGMKFDDALLRHAWKLLMENHPHDSICGCGIDAVHREMLTRFEKSMQAGGYLTKQAGEYLAARVSAPLTDEDTKVIAVFNTSGWERSEVITVEIAVERIYGTREARRDLCERPLHARHLTDRDGNEIPASYGEQRIRFGYELPGDTFRKPYFERVIPVTFSASAVPAFGWDLYYLKKGSPRTEKASGLRIGDRSMENRWVSVRIHPDGIFDICEKTTGRVYRGLGVFEDTGDVGNEYIFRETLGEPVRSDKGEAEVSCIADDCCRASFRIRQVMELPVSADDALEAAREAMVRPLTRNIGRSPKTAAFPLTTTLSLEKDSPLLRVRIEFDNTVKDHRLRMLFPTDLNTDRHLADSVFDVVERPDIPGPNWTNSSRCLRDQYFAAAEDDRGGLAVINRGNYEYEILPERKQIAVTLLRSVGEMGDWGVFPTPDAQCPGPLSMELGIYAYPGNAFRESGFREAFQFQTELLPFPAGNAEGSLPPWGSLLETAGRGIAVTAVKPSEDRGAVIIRAVNPDEQPSVWELTLPPGFRCYSSDITEKRSGEVIPGNDGCFRIPVDRKEIKTLRIEAC